MPGTKFDPKTRFTVRNLRLREDTAKYLFNLDLQSAHYDPKTRTLKTNPHEAGSECVLFLWGWGGCRKE